MELLSGFNFPLPGYNGSTHARKSFPATTKPGQVSQSSSFEAVAQPCSAKILRTLEPSPTFVQQPVATSPVYMSTPFSSSSSVPYNNFDPTACVLPSIRLPPLYPSPEPSSSAAMYHTTSSTQIVSSTTTTLSTGSSIQPQTGSPALSKIPRMEFISTMQQPQQPHQHPVRFLPQRTQTHRSFIMMPLTAYRGTGVGGGGIGKKPRKKVTPAQLAILEEAFQIGMIPDLDTRNKLAQKLGFSERRVRVWFQNRRAKLKKDNQGGQVFVNT